jgi:hypothetical protein
MQSPVFFLNKIESLRMRTKAITRLRQQVALPPALDLKPEQWEALESQLTTVSGKLMQKLKSYSDDLLSDIKNTRVNNRLVEVLGNLELELTGDYVFYDTYMDMLTQRLSPAIGSLLKGCDVIAMDGTQRGFLQEITVPPIVYCDRGFGASTCREGVHVLRDTPNPMQFIAVPYSRLVEKYNLISIYHEVGHQTLIKLNLFKLIQQVFEQQLTRAGASILVKNLFNNWVKELAPDFWAFCLTGMAQTCSLRDILFLNQEQATYISASQPHPPGYIRFLVSVHWCRHLWGKGDWDEWEKDWKEKYPLANLDVQTQEVMRTLEGFLPLAARIFCDTKYKKLDNKPISSLFTLEKLVPEHLKSMANETAIAGALFKKQPIGVQLAVFRLMRENRKFKQEYIDQAMTAWLTAL